MWLERGGRTGGGAPDPALPGRAVGKDGTTTRGRRFLVDGVDQWFGVVVLAGFFRITAMVLHDEMGEEIGELCDEVGALRAETACRNQPDDCDVARLLAQLQRDR